MDLLQVYPVIRAVWNWSRSIFGLNREHDIAIFKKIDSIANEQRIDDILNNRIFTSDHKIEYDRVLQDFIDAISRIENQYIAPVINLRARELAWEMGELLAFVRQTYWPVPGGRLKFRPDRIDSDVYDTEWKELNLRLERAWDAYKTYRIAVKERLTV
jgi:hypothetical protein